MTHCESMSLIEFQQRFPDDEACENYLFEARWPNGFHCPKCGHDYFYFHSSYGLLQCTNSNCRHQTSLTAETIMRKTRTPLYKWLWAIFLYSRDKRGISATTLRKQIGVSHWGAWTMLQKIRKTMVSKDSRHMLDSLIEIDDAFIGHGGKRGRGTKKAKVVVSASITEGGKPQFAQMDVVSDHSQASFLSHVQKSVVNGGKIKTDGFKGYNKLSDSAYTLR